MKHYLECDRLWEFIQKLAAPVSTSLSVDTANEQRNHDQQNQTSEENDDDDIVRYISDTESEDIDSEDQVSSDSSDKKWGQFDSPFREWVNKADIALCHVNTLLGIVRTYFPGLQKRYHTLVSTWQAYNLNDIADGTYHHFGLATGVLDRFSSNPKLLPLANLRIKFNMDGVPLFKSTNEQFWPIQSEYLSWHRYTIFLL